MARISADQIGLRDAAEVFGVSIDTLRRRIRDNQLDEAVLVQGPFGATWVLPKAEMAAIAHRENWDGSSVSMSVGVDVSRVSAPTHAPAQVVEAVDVAAPPVAESAVTSAVIDLSDQSGDTPPVRGRAAGAPALVPGGDELVLAVSATVAEELARGLSENVQAELAGVREAITAAEVKAVAADARTDALRAEKGRLEAQLKRAEADIEYWRSQHDRLSRDLDRERGLRVAADKAKSIAESETRVIRERVAELSVEVSDTQARERVLIAAEASLQSELDQASMAMGWWSRRRLAKLQARSTVRTPPSPVGD